VHGNYIYIYTVLRFPVSALNIYMSAQKGCQADEPADARGRLHCSTLQYRHPESSRYRTSGEPVQIRGILWQVQQAMQGVEKLKQDQAHCATMAGCPSLFFP
jgi:hypothetical protein